LDASQQQSRRPAGFRERRVATLFHEVLGVPVVSADADFFALGGDEVSARRLLDVVEEDAGVRLPPRALVESPTVRTLARRIARTRPTRNTRVVGFGTDLPGRPLFCTIAAFQSRAIATEFNRLAGRPFYALQHKGLEGRAVPDRSFERRGRRAADDIRSIQPAGPYLLAGYSYNGWVALEAARALIADGERVERLIAIDVWAPVFDRRTVRRLQHESRWHTIEAFNPDPGPCFDLRRRILVGRETARHHADRFAWWVRSWTAGIVPRGATLQSQLLHHVATRADGRYRPEPVDVDLLLVRADEFGPPDWRRRRAEPDMSWRRMVTGRVDVVHVSGTHASIVDDDAPKLAERLSEAMPDRGWAGAVLSRAR